MPATSTQSFSDEDKADSALPVMCRFQDLVGANITKNWPHLLRLIDDEGFPPGVMLSKNIRAWVVADINKWLAARPTARKMVAPARRPRRKPTAAEGAGEGADHG